MIRDWRPFLNEAPAETGEPLYRVNHASFQEFLAEEGVGLQPYHETHRDDRTPQIPGLLDDASG